MPYKSFFTLSIFFLSFTWANLNAEELKKTFFDAAKTKIRSEITYVDKKKEGPSKSFYMNGQVEQEAIFKNDKKNGPAKKYYESGSLKAEFSYVNGFISGLYKEYHPNGKLKIKTQYYEQKDHSVLAPIFDKYKATVLMGKEIEYYDDGVTIFRNSPVAFFRMIKDQEGKIRHDVRRAINGIETYYKKDGSILKTVKISHDHIHGEPYRFNEDPTSNTQLVPTDAVVAIIPDQDILE